MKLGVKTNVYIYAEFNGDVHFFCLGSKIPLLVKFSPKNQICVTKMKLGVSIDSIMLYTKVMFICPALDKNYIFLQTLYKK